MRTIDLTTDTLSLDELLDSVGDDVVMVRSADGSAFMVSRADEFATEVELLRRNHTFLTLLDSYKQDRRTLSLAEAEERLRNVE